MLNSREIAAVIEKRKKVINSEFVIFYSPSQLGNCRFGIGISCKLVKKATQRNYYKRQIKNILVSHKNLYQNPSSHYDLVIIIRPEFLMGQFLTRQVSLVRLLGSIFQEELRIQSAF